MTNRLTKNKGSIYGYSTNELELVNKLGQIEDLMEEYGISDVSELGSALSLLQNIEDHDFMIISTDECDQLIQSNDLLQLLIKKQANIQDLKQSKRLIDYNIDKKRNQKLTLDQFNALKQYMKKRR